MDVRLSPHSNCINVYVARTYTTYTTYYEEFSIMMFITRSSKKNQSAQELVSLSRTRCGAAGRARVRTSSTYFFRSSCPTIEINFAATKKRRTRNVMVIVDSSSSSTWSLRLRRTKQHEPLASCDRTIHSHIRTST